MPRKGFSDKTFMLGLESYSVVMEDFSRLVETLEELHDDVPRCIGTSLTYRAVQYVVYTRGQLDQHSTGLADTDKEINTCLIAKTKGEAGTIVSQGQGYRCKASRLLAPRYETKRAETN